MGDGCAERMQLLLTAQDGGHFDPMLLERWPIVQAFALEGFGGYVFLKSLLSSM